MRVTTLSLGQLQTNCYLAWDEDTHSCVIIDPADDADFITDEILKEQLHPKFILLTHGHFDHVLGIFELTMNFGVPLFIHEADQPLYLKSRQSASHWLRQDIKRISPPVKTPHFYSKEQIFKFGNSSLKVTETPGHTPGSVCLISASPEPIIFTGDTLFSDSVGRTNFSYSSKSELSVSIKKISKFPPESTIYPGHGESTTLEQALQNIL